MNTIKVNLPQMKLGESYNGEFDPEVEFDNVKQGCNSCTTVAITRDRKVRYTFTPTERGDQVKTITVSKSGEKVLQYQFSVKVI